MSGGPATPWSKVVGLSEARRGVDIRVEADAEDRATIALALDLESLDRLEATLHLEPWLDGAALTGSWRATIEQICGISLDPFSTELEGEIAVRLLPAGSQNAPPDPQGEVVVDPEAPDPPDLLDGETIDLGAYVIEHLAMEIDPFPRKPGVAFEPPAEPPPSSPFDVLRGLKRG